MSLSILATYFFKPFLCTCAIAFLYVHNSKLTRNLVRFGVYGLNAIVIVAVNGVTSTQTLGAAPAFATATIVPAWTDDTWVQVIVTVQSTSGTGGFYGLYILESPLLEADLP